MAAALLFVFSLGYCLIAYTVTFGIPAVGPRRAVSVLWNIGLFTAFACHHSLFARTPVRRAVERVLPADLERSLYVSVASVLLVAVCWWWRAIPGTAWQLEGAARWFGFAAQGAGIWMTLRSAAVLGIGRLSGLERSSPGNVAEFRTDGPYGWVRHPIYTGWCLIVFGAPVMTMTRLVFATVSTFYLVVAIPLEERTLAGGSDTYARYAAKVRWRLLPGVY
jgi:protein-S-isoprenylcysteine O-methyltransferase Ste14